MSERNEVRVETSGSSLVRESRVFSHLLNFSTHSTMSSRTGKLPQWWLDNTPHDTLEEQVERRRIALEEKIAEEEENFDDNVIICGDTINDNAEDDGAPIESLKVNGTPNDDDEQTDSLTTKQNGYKRAPRSSPITLEEYASTDYKIERAKLKPVVSDNENTKKNAISPTNSLGSSIKSPSSTTWTKDVDSPLEAALPESAPTISPAESTKNTPDSINASQKPVRHFKTSFTGVSVFDFAMQQRAREQERREKERLARESLARHHAETFEYDKASQHKLKSLEEKRRKKEAEENIKKFKKVTLDSDLATELKKRHQEERRQKREACEKHHEYKSTS